MPPAWSDKRERQYVHIEQAARRVEAARPDRRALDDIPARWREGLRSPGARGLTKAQLYREARRRGIDGRSSMTKVELLEAVGR